MPESLHDVARRMAKAGWLHWTTNANQPLQPSPFDCGLAASEAGLAWAAIQYARERRWNVMIVTDAVSEVQVFWNDGDDREVIVEGTTALSVLLAVERACETADKEAT